MAQNFYASTISSSITSTELTIPVNTLPSEDSGYLVLEANSLNKREIIKFSSKAGSSVIVDSLADRGVGGTTAQAHESGVTVEMNVVAEHINDLEDSFAALNEEWQSWTPTLANLTLGNGSVVAKYKQIGKTVHFRFEFTMGSTSAVGTAPTFTLPVAADQAIPGFAVATICDGSAFCGGNIYSILGNLTSSTVVSLRIQNAASTYVIQSSAITATVPATWTTTNIIYVQGEYEAA